MPRRARIILVGIPHHITQRGSRRQQVFFEKSDYEKYLVWYRRYARSLKIETLGYCLMPNHVHFVAAPSQSDSFHRLYKSLHVRYSQMVNKRFDWSGHLWQARYYSSALGSEYIAHALRYVDLNPVRAHLADAAKDYPWSSAAVHLGTQSDPWHIVTPNWRQWTGITDDWGVWLSHGDKNETADRLRMRTARDLPLVSEKRLVELEQQTGRVLRIRPRGRPPKPAK